MRLARTTIALPDDSNRYAANPRSLARTATRLAILMLWLTSAASGQEDFRRGDADLDGHLVTGNDIRTASPFLGSTLCPEAADFDGDGSVTFNDLVGAFFFAAGLGDVP